MMNPADASRALNRQIYRGSTLIMMTRLLVRALGFISTLVIARLLVPEDFGLVAIGVAAMQLLQNISDMGAAQTVIKFSDSQDDDINTIFTVNVLRGLILCIILVVIAPIAATTYGDARIQTVFLALACLPLINGLHNPRFFEFERELNFSKALIAAVSSKFCGAALSITIAVAFRSYLALIAGMLASGLVQVLISYALKPWRPAFTVRAFPKIWGFTRWVTGVSLVTAINNKLDILILGRATNPTIAGLYFIGEELSALPTRETGEPIARALYPGLQKLRDDPAQMRRAFMRSVEALSVTALPAAFGLAFVCADLIPLLLGARWQAAIPVIQVLAPILGLQVLLMTVESYAMSASRLDLVFYRELIFAALRIPIFIWATFKFALWGALGVALAGGLIHFAMNLAIYAQLTDRPSWEPLAKIWRSLIAVMAMCVGLFLLAAGLREVPVVIALALRVVAGIAIFSGTLACLWRLAGRPAGIEADFEMWVRDLMNGERVRGAHENDQGGNA